MPYAGDTYNATVILPDYANWGMQYRLKGPGGDYSTNATANPAGEFTVSFPASVTQAWQPGQYRVFLVMSQGTNRQTIAYGQVAILPTLDQLSIKPGFWAGVVEKIKAVIENRAAQDVLEYEIAGRQLRKMTPTDLMNWYEYACRKARQEENDLFLVQKRASRQVIPRF